MSRTSLRLVWASLRLALLGCLPAAAQQTTFDFHSNFWVNLHHFLYEQAISKSPEPCDSADWQRALDIYRKDIATHELLSRDNLQGWWPQHNRANLAWIAAATPLVAKYETAMKKELSAAYQTPWPPDPIRTNVAEYASWAGAYTALDPTHITVSSSGTVTQAAVETLFHEASQRSCFSGAPSGTRCSFLHSRRSCAAESG